MSNTLDKLLWKIVPYAMTYCAGRKMFLLNDATVVERQKNPDTGCIEYNNVQLLWTQKAAISALSGVCAPLLPYYMYEDVKRCERYIRGIPDKRVSPWDSQIVDYIFM